MLGRAVISTTAEASFLPGSPEVHPAASSGLLAQHTMSVLLLGFWGTVYALTPCHVEVHRDRYLGFHEGGCIGI